MPYQPHNPTMPPEWNGPPRPLDTWRVCGRHIRDTCPCTEDPWGPSPLTVIAANKRLSGELGGSQDG